jgi:hypothetical protein
MVCDRLCTRTLLRTLNSVLQMNESQINHQSNSDLNSNAEHQTP